MGLISTYRFSAIGAIFLWAMFSGIDGSPYQSSSLNGDLMLPFLECRTENMVLENCIE